MTIPTCQQIGNTFEARARALAPIVAIAILAAHLTYDAGHAFGAWVHRLNDWLAGKPEPMPVPQPATISKPKPAPIFAELLISEGCKVLTDAELAAEIAQYDAKTLKRKKTVARRKPAGARRVAAGVA